MTLAFLPNLGLVLALAPLGTETWDELAAAYEERAIPWAREMNRTGGWSKPESERPPSPDAEFWPRFEALAASGEGRAVLWLLQNPQGEGEARTAQLQTNFARVRAAGAAEWVGPALLVLAGEVPALGAGELSAFFDQLAASAHPAPLRATALVARAALESDTERARQAELYLRAAFLRWREVDLAPGEDVLPEDVQEVAEQALEDLEKDNDAWWAACFREGGDGTYYSGAAFRPNPRDAWQPVLEVLALRGASSARAWILFNTWPRDEAEKERSRGHLDALSREELDAETLEEMRWMVASLVQSLGPDFVEPRVRAICARADEEARRGLVYGLGDGLCETAGADGDAQRQRGLALLREVCERWPGSDDARRATGKLFRHENLVVGKPAPDFETVDAEGNAFKLSDYKGKVTVIDFWGFW